MTTQNSNTTKVFLVEYYKDTDTGRLDYVTTIEATGRRVAKNKFCAEHPDAKGIKIRKLVGRI